MTDIIARSANFSKGRIMGYTPPCGPIDYFGWFGGGIDDSVRNFGTLGEAAFVGAIQGIGEHFIDLSNAGYIETPFVGQGNAFTAFTVGAQLIPGGTARGYFLSSEYDVTETLRRGTSIYTNANRHTALRLLGDGTRTGTSINADAKNSDASTWAAVMYRVTEQSDGSLKLELKNLTAGTTATTTISSGSVINYERRKALIGSSYTKALTGTVRMACMGAAGRALSDSEIDSLYASAKRRMSNFGVTI